MDCFEQCQARALPLLLDLIARQFAGMSHGSNEPDRIVRAEVMIFCAALGGFDQFAINVGVVLAKTGHLYCADAGFLRLHWFRLNRSLNMPITPETDLALMQRAIALAVESRNRGDHPFGALLAGPDGEILLEDMNTCGTKGDRTGHAERNLMTAASLKYEVDFLRTCTMYTSAEPCAMCAGSVYWTGVGRVVHGMTEKALKDLIGPDPENLTMDLSCREVFAAGQRPVEVVGPLLSDESAVVHDGFWTS